MSTTVTASVTQTTTESFTRTKPGGTITLPPPPPPPGVVIAVLDAQRAADDRINRKSIAVTITLVLLYLIPETWEVRLGGLVIEDFGTQSRFLMTLSLLWVMRSIAVDLRDEVGRDQLIIQCKVSLAPEDLAAVEVREEKRKFVPPLRSRGLRMASGAFYIVGAVAAALLFFCVLGLLGSKLFDVFVEALLYARQGDEVALGVVIFMALLLINIMGNLMSSVIEELGARAR